MSPSIVSTKKRKQSSSAIEAEIPAKKSKTGDKKKDGKGKARDCEFCVVKASLVVSIPPVFAGDPHSGVEEMLDSMVMRYIPALQGVVLSHSNLDFVDKTATIKADCPFLVSKVDFEATVWSPHVGMKLVGKVNLCSPDHVSLLVHRTFNVSIPRHHLPQDQWEFEYGPAENDPEFRAVAQDEENEDETKTEEKREEESEGKWVHKLTGERLGGPNGFLEFTVIGLTVANEMLSLLGSIQPDPFSPEHVAHAQANTRSGEDAEEEDIGAEVEVEGTDEEDEADSDEDPFQALGRRQDEAAAAEEAKRKAEEAEQAAKSENKRKRKAEKTDGKEEAVASKEKKQKRKKP